MTACSFACSHSWILQFVPHTSQEWKKLTPYACGNCYLTAYPKYFYSYISEWHRQTCKEAVPLPPTQLSGNLFCILQILLWGIITHPDELFIVYLWICLLSFWNFFCYCLFLLNSLGLLPFSKLSRSLWTLTTMAFSSCPHCGVTLWYCPVLLK